MDANISPTGEIIPFTDEHLKKLCEEMEDRNCVGYAKITIPLFSALVTRLRSAERLFEYAKYYEPVSEEDETEYDATVANWKSSKGQ